MRTPSHGLERVLELARVILQLAIRRVLGDQRELDDVDQARREPPDLDLRVSAANPGRSALTSRVTSSYFLSASASVSNSMAMNDTPSRTEVSIFMHVVERREAVLDAAWTTSRSRSFGSAPG